MRRFVPVLVAVAAIVAVHAVAAGAAPKPCRLVTAADATRALGGAVRAGKAQTLGLYASCTYRSRAGFMTLTVQSRAIGRADFVRSAKANPGPVKRIAGVGSEAFSAGGVLLAWKRGIEVTVLAFGVGNPPAAEKRAALAALARV